MTVQAVNLHGHYVDLTQVWDIYHDAASNDLYLNHINYGCLTDRRYLKLLEKWLELRHLTRTKE